MRRWFGRAAGIAGGADPAAIAGKRDQKVVTAISAAGPGEAVGEDAAFEVTEEFLLDVGRHQAARFILRHPCNRLPGRPRRRRVAGADPIAIEVLPKGTRWLSVG